MNVLLPGVCEFAGRVSFLQGFYLSVFQDELVDDVGEARGPQLETFDGSELLWRTAGKFEREAVAGLIGDLESDFCGCEVGSREALQKFCIQSFGLARENDLGFVKGNDCVVHVALGIGAKVHREFAVLFVIGRVEAIVMEMGHRKLKFVKSKLELITGESNLEDAVRRVLILSGVAGQRMRRLL